MNGRCGTDLIGERCYLISQNVKQSRLEYEMSDCKIIGGKNSQGLRGQGLGRVTYLDIVKS